MARVVQEEGLGGTGHREARAHDAVPGNRPPFSIHLQYEDQGRIAERFGNRVTIGAGSGIPVEISLDARGSCFLLALGAKKQVEPAIHGCTDLRRKLGRPGLGPARSDRCGCAFVPERRDIGFRRCGPLSETNFPRLPVGLDQFSKLSQ